MGRFSIVVDVSTVAIAPVQKKDWTLEASRQELSEEVSCGVGWHPLGCRANRAGKIAPGGCDKHRRTDGSTFFAGMFVTD